MPQALKIADGMAINYTPGTAITSGDVVTFGTFCGVAIGDIAANTLGAVAVRGVYDVAKQAALAIALGDAVYWDDANNVANTTPSNPLLGYCVAAAVGADATVRVALAGTPLALSPGSIANEATGVAVPFILRAVVTAGGAGDQNLPAMPRKARVVDAWIRARDTQAANVKIHSGTAGADDITSAVAKGTTDNAIVRFTSIVEAKAVLNAAVVPKANFSAAGSVEVNLFCVPVP